MNFVERLDGQVAYDIVELGDTDTERDIADVVCWPAGPARSTTCDPHGWTRGAGAAAGLPDLVRGIVLLAAGGLFPSTPLFEESLARAGDADLPMEERLAAFGRAYFEDGGDPSLWWRPPSTAAWKIKDADAGPTAVWWSGGASPMLVLQGELDQSAPPANGEALHAADPRRVELHTIAGAAHTLPIDRPAQCAELVSDWLARRN